MQEMNVLEYIRYKDVENDDRVGSRYRVYCRQKIKDVSSVGRVGSR